MPSGELFNEAEEIVEQAYEPAVDDSETITYTRRKKRAEKIADDIRRERVIHDIAEKDKFCDCCDHPLHLSQNAKGAKASAILYSIVECAKTNGLVPYDYIVYLLEAFTHPNPNIEQLLPWNVKLNNGL